MIILASASPRRQELLKRITADFRVAPADMEETVPEGVPLQKHPQYLAEQKAGLVSLRFPHDTVIGADTGVFIEHTVLGKPKNEQDAERMLHLLSGKTHQVITGCAICRAGQCTSFCSVTDVTFYPLSDEEIKAYIASGEPFDKAGGYGIQQQGALLVKEIRGDYFNVVGLPVARLQRALKQII